jgi:hypothetical protein
MTTFPPSQAFLLQGAGMLEFSFPLKHGISRYLEGLFSAERREARAKVESHRLNLPSDSRRDMN